MNGTSYPVTPLATISPDEIRSYDVATIGDLLKELSSRTRGSGGDDPVILINGRRASGPSEIAGLPPEAILRLDMLPESAASRLGLPAGRRVLNFILREPYRAVSAEVSLAATTEGGGAKRDGRAALTRLSGGSLLNLSVRHTTDQALSESDRDVRRASFIDMGFGNAGVGLPDLDRYRSLIPSRQATELTGSAGRTVGAVRLSLTGAITTSRARSLVGLSTDDPAGVRGGVQPVSDVPGRPLAIRSSADAHRLAATLDGNAGRLTWSATASLDQNRSRTDTAGSALAPRGNGSGAGASSTSVVRTGRVEARAFGTAAHLPSGPLVASVTLTGEVSRGGVRASGPVDLARATTSRSLAKATAEVYVPLTSGSAKTLPLPGDLSAQLDLTVDRLSGFGTTALVGYGLNWSPAETLSLSARVTGQRTVPANELVSAPVTLTPGVLAFDYATGRTAVVTQVSGGLDGELVAGRRRTVVLSLLVRPHRTGPLTFQTAFTRDRASGAYIALPPLTAAIERAFPDRFGRDGTGVLDRIDVRLVPVEEVTEILRSGFNLLLPLKRRGTPRTTSASPDVGASLDRGGVVQVALFHTFRRRSQLRIRADLPAIDRLGDAAVGSGGQPRHEIDLQAGVTGGAVGMRLEGRWRSATAIRTGAGAAEHLRFSGLGTFDLRLFGDLDRLLSRTSGWTRNARLSVDLANVLNGRQDVRDGAGKTPLAYQRALLDPLGRVARLTLRKTF